MCVCVCWIVRRVCVLYDGGSYRHDMYYCQNHKDTFSLEGEREGGREREGQLRENTSRIYNISEINRE